MANGKFVSYLRVSTARQGSSGLGIEAQRESVTRYLNGGEWTLVAEVVEIESGRRADRPELERALSLCRAHRAALVVAKVDRLTRSVGFLSRLLEAGVEIRFVDLPAIEGPTGRFILNQMASVAELEAGMISARTKAALAASKARGVTLGGFRDRSGTSADCERARAQRTAQAVKHAGDLSDLFNRLDPAGSLSLRAMASALNTEGIPTATGRGGWTAAGVARVRARFESAN